MNKITIEDKSFNVPDGWAVAIFAKEGNSLYENGVGLPPKVVAARVQERVPVTVHYKDARRNDVNVLMEGVNEEGVAGTAVCLAERGRRVISETITVKPGETRRPKKFTGFGFIGNERSGDDVVK